MGFQVWRMWRHVTTTDLKGEIHSKRTPSGAYKSWYPGSRRGSRSTWAPAGMNAFDFGKYTSWTIEL
eukprot:2049310-Rhodomonas_salina.3